VDTNERRPASDQLDEAATKQLAATTATVTDSAADLHAWSSVFLDDGRVISIAWLRGYAGAVASRWRRYR